MAEQRGLVLGLEIDGDGCHPAAWRQAAHPPAQLLTAARLTRVAETAERAGFSFLTLDDDITPPGTAPGITGRIGSVERAAYLSAALSLASVVPVIPTTYTEPFHVSSQLASLDYLTAGRSGWLASVTADPAAARAWGRPAVTGAEPLRREAADSVEVVRALWDSWEDDAVIRDAASGRYLDRGRLHYIDFAGESYSVRGPAIVPRPPQGQLVVLARAGLLPGQLADVSLITAPDLPGVRAAAAASGTARTFAEIEVALDAGGQTGAQRAAGLDRHAAWPEQGRLRYTGSPDGLVALLRELAGVVDGARLHPLVLDEDLPVLSRLVIPPLAGARAVRRPLPGETFRDLLGLPRPVSRYAAVPAPSAPGASR